MLLEQEPVYQGSIWENSWQSQLVKEQSHDPTIGIGLVCIRTNGLPVALIWGFVDDFKIHALTKEKLIVALNAFMDLALKLGLVCQWVKTKPQAQFVRSRLRGLLVWTRSET
jgi:hypothetical protein